MSRSASLFAARAVAQSLSRPAPEFLDSISLVKACRVLTQELPLTLDSPFGVLPDVPRVRAGIAPADPAGRIDAPKLDRRQPVPSPSLGPRDTKLTPLPVFSFRRSARSATPEQAVHAAPSIAPNVDAIVRNAPAPNLPALQSLKPPETRLLTMQRPEFTSPDAPAARLAAAMTTHPDAPARPRQTTHQAMELLDSIATELLGAPSTFARNSSASAPPTSSPQSSGSPQPPALSYGFADLGHPALAHAVARPDLPDLDVSRASPSAPASLAPRPSAATAPSAVTPSPAPSPNLDPDLLASLVNEVLVEQARRHGVDLS